MQVSNSFIAGLIYKHICGEELSVEEKRTLDSWIGSSDQNRVLFERLANREALQEEVSEYAQASENIWTQVRYTIKSEENKVSHSRNPWRRIAAAAAVFLLLSAVVYVGFVHKSSKTIAGNAAPHAPKDVLPPSSSHATITFSNGDQVLLDSAAYGSLAIQANTNVEKLSDGRIVYKTISTGSGIAPVQNTITNPRGSKPLLVTLSDGSDVWLNAASTITYVVGERAIVMTGEAYFEITENKSYPFKVNVAGKGEIAVLGTHFNVNAYADEATINTTLLEGSIKFTNLTTKDSKLIVPGQQIRLTGSGSLNVVDNINTEQVMSWRYGKFMFKSADVETVLRQAARWYDLQVIYENGKPTDRFTGGFSKDITLKQFFDILEYSELHFRLEPGKKLIITGSNRP